MKERRFSYESMGTHWEVVIWDEVSDSFFVQLQAEIIRESEEFNRTYSRFIKDSLVWKLADQRGTVNVPRDFVSMLKIYSDLYEASGRKLNPLIGFSLSDLGYDETYSLEVKNEIRKPKDFHEAVKILSKETIKINKPGLIDFGALGKGFFVDKIFKKLTKHGLNHILVNGSGDIRYKGPEPITLGLEDPENPSRVIGSFKLKNGAFAASGSNRRSWGTQHHIIDPESTKSPNYITASWVHTESATLADAIATTLFLSPPAPLLKSEPFSYCLMNNKRKIKRSADFSAELF